MCRAQHLGRVGFWVPINGIWFSAHALCSLSVGTPMSLGEVKLGNTGLERSRAGDNWWDPPHTWHLHPKSPWAIYARSPHSCIVEVGEGFPQFLLRLVKQPKLISKSWVIAFLGFLGRTSPRVAASSEVLLANTSLPSFLQDAILQIPLYKFFTPKAIVYKTFS